MSRYYQRPENALKRANEFIEVEKPLRALDSLGEVIKSKKYRSTTYSEKVLEPIMIKYLELCVDLKKAYMAKEGLFQYRNMCQAVNVASLENVVRFYLQLAEERTEAARQESHQAVIDIDDLDNVATPESLLLRAVSGEDAQDRSDRVILLPWVKFLWESYRQCLELLRTNSRVEKLYHDTAQQAFKFCLKYSRKTEFRKLCENLRSHLGLLAKGTPSPTSVNMNNPETQQMNLETRLLQLDYAIQMELWQEAYKAIEDIHGLMTLSKKMPKPQQMAQYYQKLALVFGKAGNHLFHAAALFRLFQLSRDLKKNITPEELQKLGSRVLVATLAIPLPSAHPEFDRFIETEKNAMEKTQKLATLLHLTQQPTRVGLIKDLVRLGIVQIAMPQLQQLYKLLEVDFDPLRLCKQVKGILESLGQSDETGYLAQYVPALEEITLTRLVKQIAQMYSTIEFNRLLQLAPFATAFDLERVVVNAVRHNDMQIRIDHRNRCLHFGTDLSEAQREDLPEGPTLQVMPSEQIRTHLISMYTVLEKATSSIRNNKPTAEDVRLKTDLVKLYHQTKASDHAQLLRRQRDIEMRKEYLEKLNTEREEEEVRRQEELLRQQMLAEQRRLEQERQERERLRQEAELRQAQARHMKEKVAQISQTAVGQRVIKKLEEEDLSKLDPDVIMARQVEEMEKERKELQAKLKSQEKKVDYLERAKRQEEIPLLEKYLEERQVQDRVVWEQQEKERIAQLIEERKLAVAHRDRLLRMKEEKDGFLDRLISGRRNVYKQQLDEFEKMFSAEKARRLAARREQRREQRRQKWIADKEEEEQRKRDEELKRQREEAERAEMARREAEEEERRRLKAIQDATAEKQRQRLLEIEEKERQRDREIREKEQERLREKERERERERERDRKPAEPSSWRREAPVDSAPRDRDSARPNVYVPPGENKTWRTKGDKYSRAGNDAPPAPEPERKERAAGSSWRTRTEPEAPESDRFRDRGAPPPERRPPRDFDGDRDRDRDSRGARDFASLRSGPRGGDAPRERRMDDRRGDDRRPDERRGDDRRADDRRPDERRGDDRRADDRGPSRREEPVSNWRAARPQPSDDRDARPRPSADDRPRADRGPDRDPRGKGDRDQGRPVDRDREIRRPVDGRTNAEREEERKQRQRREEIDEDGFTRVARR